MAAQRVAIVTGANKGLGYSIVRNLALKYRSSALSKPDPPTSSTSGSSSSSSSSSTSSTNPLPFLIYLTARSRERGEGSIASIYNDEELTKERVLQKDGGPVEVRFHELDLANTESMWTFNEFIHKEHVQRDGGQGVNVLVNNAGIAPEGIDAETASLTLRTNWTGPIILTSFILPHMPFQSTSRIVNISSLLGKLTTPKFSASIITSFRQAVEQNRHEILLELLPQYINAVKAGTWEKDGWPASPYAVSKAGLTGSTLVIGRNELRGDFLREQRGFGPVFKNGEMPRLINACCPGYVKTDMTKGRGRHTAEKAAELPVKLALGDIGGVGGEFWEHGEVSTW